MKKFPLQAAFAVTTQDGGSNAAEQESVAQVWIAPFDNAVNVLSATGVQENADGHGAQAEYILQNKPDAVADGIGGPMPDALFVPTTLDIGQTGFSSSDLESAPGASAGSFEISASEERPAFGQWQEEADGSRFVDDSNLQDDHKPTEDGSCAVVSPLNSPAGSSTSPDILANTENPTQTLIDLWISKPTNGVNFALDNNQSIGVIQDYKFVGYQSSDTGSASTAPIDGVLPATESFAATTLGAELINSASLGEVRSSGATITNTGVITDAGVGPDGANVAEVKQALDDSGLNVNGSGITVGVLSDSFNDLGGAAADEANGALPPAADIDVIKDLASGGTDEGRAMMQIIHDIAPGADLAFYTAFDSEQDFANGILALAAAGCKVIVDDVGYFDEPFFQNGVIAQAIQTVEAEGVTYVTAAGNEASNGYQAAWNPTSGLFHGTTLIDAEDFGGSSPLVQTVNINTEGTGDDVPLILEWNQAYGTVSASTADLEILVFNSSGTLIGTATNAADGEPTNPWVEYDFTQSGTYYVAVENLHTGTNPGLIKEITEGDGLPATISGSNTGTVVGHSMTPGAITTGAVSVADTPAFGVNPTISESFSSSGAGTELLFADNGTPLSSPDVLSPVAVSGVDDIETTVTGDLSDFYGTSAAAASLAGVAALILSANPNLTPAQVEQIMEETALPMANSAVSGAGLVQVDPAVEVALAAEQPVVTVSDVTLSAGQSSVAASSLFSASDVSGESITEYGFMDTGPGDFVLNGVTEPDNQEIDITAAQLSQLSYQGVPGTIDTLQIRAEDVTGWGNWASFTVATPKVIQTDTGAYGSTSLVEVGNNFFLYPAGGSSGPELTYQGTPESPGTAPEGSWMPIGAVKMASGYDVAWELPGANEYTVSATDNNGNYVSNLIGVVPGNSTALEALEPTFNQDLNGDGVIGIPTKVIQTDTGAYGSTSLVEVGNNFFLYPAGGSSGPELTYQGTPESPGTAPEGSWMPIGAVKTASGYDVAWELPGANEYTVSATDNNGNYVSNLIGVVPGNSTALEALEPTFNQDLNGDGVIGIPAGGSGAAIAGTGATHELAFADYASATFSFYTGMLKLLSTPGSEILQFVESNSVSSGGADGTTQNTFRSEASSLADHLNDTFVFPATLGDGAIANSAPEADASWLQHTGFAAVAVELSAIQHDGVANVSMNDMAHDMVTLHGDVLAQFHLAHFHTV
jgi:Tryptophan-rich Synechocystis species C-terminal domain/Subtilase family